jgi:NitT/TauT family transport system substrate-binding protein
VPFVRFVVQNKEMKMKRLLMVLLLLLLAACAAPAVTPTAAPTQLRQIRLPMGFIPSVQYANFYVAAEKGYFAEAGIEVEFDYSFETNGVALVGANQLPFAVVSGEQVLLARAQGLPVVYVMAWFQKFPVAVIAKADSGIMTPADLRGKRIGVPDLSGASFIGLRALLAANGLKPDDVTLENIGFTQAEALSAGRVDAAVVYANNEPIRLAAKGEKLNVIQVSDYAALAANGLLSNEATVEGDPELVRVFVRAVVRGTQDVITNPDEAYAIAKKYAPDALKDDALEKQVLAATIELWKTDRVGWTDVKAWEAMNAALVSGGLLKAPVDVKAAFTNAFVP